MAGGPAAIDTREEESGGGFENGERRALEEVGETNEDIFFAAADGEGERFVGIEVDVKARREAFAVETSVDALKKSGAAGDGSREFGHRLGVVYEWEVERSKRAKPQVARPAPIEERFLHYASPRVRTEANAKKKRRLAPVEMTRLDRREEKGRFTAQRVQSFSINFCGGRGVGLRLFWPCRSR